jgi:rRNA maturation endonuclease Nob1
MPKNHWIYCKFCQKIFRVEEYYVGYVGPRDLRKCPFCGSKDIEKHKKST